MEETKRGRFEIIATILKLAKKGSSKTKIVYHGNLNFTILDTYTKTLEKNHLATKEEGKLKVTPKGVLYLERFAALEGLIEA
jgi:predicted transcriptional regulator